MSTTATASIGTLGPITDPTEARGRAAVVGLATLAVLNLADVVLTRLFLHRGLPEGNPIGRVLMSSGSALVVKLGLVGALAARAARRRVSLVLVCATWAVVGVYVLAVVVNAWALSVAA